MFERYTEQARRTIFFARYEASQFGCHHIEAEHLLLGLLREDKALANRFLRSHAAVESIRRQIEVHTTVREKVSTSVDLPLSHECKRVVAYGAEEAERLNHTHIGTEHLLLGLLREENSFAAQMLHERGLTLHLVRKDVRQSEPSNAKGRPASTAGLERWLAAREGHVGAWTIEPERVGTRTTRVLIYGGAQPNEDETSENAGPAEELANIQKRIVFITERMEHAIANHEFEKARFYSDEERKEREKMRLLLEQFNLREPPPRVPLLCIEMIYDDRFSEIQKRCDDYIAKGVVEVWLLDPQFRRAYTVNKTEGLREFKGEVLQTGNPPLEMDLRTIFE